VESTERFAPQSPQGDSFGKAAGNMAIDQAAIRRCTKIDCCEGSEKRLETKVRFAPIVLI
jgi:hypothetical protein